MSGTTAFDRLEYLPLPKLARSCYKSVTQNFTVVHNEAKSPHRLTQVLVNQPWRFQNVWSFIEYLLTYANISQLLCTSAIV